MAHFYSGIQGNRGPATRMGSKTSGIGGYVQSWNARLAVSMHANGDGSDDAMFRIGDGPRGYGGGALALSFRDTATIVDALGSGDAKIEAIAKRIRAEVDRLNAEAPKAIKRRERRQE